MHAILSNVIGLRFYVTILWKGLCRVLFLRYLWFILVVNICQIRSGDIGSKINKLPSVQTIT